MTLAQAFQAAAAAASSLLPLARIPVSQAQAARDRTFVSRPLGGASIQAEITADGSGEFWIRLRQDGRDRVLPLSDLESSARRACFGAACYAVDLEQNDLVVRPEDARNGEASFSLDKLADAVLANAPQARLSEDVVYSAVYEPGPTPGAGAVLWHRDLSGGVYIAYRTPQELASNTWLVVVNGIYIGVRREGDDLVFSAKPAEQSLAGPIGLRRQRRVPGT